MHSATRTTGEAWASTRIPTWKRKLLESVQERRGDRHLAHTVEAALDLIIEQHFPGSVVTSESSSGRSTSDT